MSKHRYNDQVDLQNRSRSPLNMLIESRHATSYLMAIVILPFLSPFWRCAIGMCMKMEGRMRLSSCWQLLRLLYLSSFARYSLWKYAWCWPLEWAKVKCKYAWCWPLEWAMVKCKYAWCWPLEWAKVKCKYANGNAVEMLPYPSSFTGYSQSKCIWHWPLPLEWDKVNRKYANELCDFVFVDGNNIYPDTVCKIFTDKMCITLTLTFRME